MRPSAYRTWLFLSLVTALINTTVFTTAAVYFVRDVGANPLQLVLIGTVMEFAIFLFELPTGAFADSHGRRASVVRAPTSAAGRSGRSSIGASRRRR